MQLVIADTGPVNYLLLIGNIDILPALFQKVVLPSAVQDEPIDPRTPTSVRNWMNNPPFGWMFATPRTHSPALYWMILGKAKPPR